MKVLIVEDNKDIAWIWKEGLIAKNYTVEIAEDGEKAITLAKKFKPDAIILDLILPKKDGLDVLKDLKEKPELKDVIVVIASNLSDNENIEKALSLGAVDYFIKSQNRIKEIIEKIEKYLTKNGKS